MPVNKFFKAFEVPQIPTLLVATSLSMLLPILVLMLLKLSVLVRNRISLHHLNNYSDKGLHAEVSSNINFRDKHSVLYSSFINVDVIQEFPPLLPPAQIAPSTSIHREENPSSALYLSTLNLRKGLRFKLQASK